MTEAVVEKVTDLICRMTADFQSRTPANPVTREDIRGYVEEAFLLEEEEDSSEEETCTPTIITIPIGAHASTW